MASTQAMCTSFKQELLNGIHAFGTSVVRAGTGADAFKIALYTDTATNGAATTVYSATNEVASAGYTAGGSAVTFVAPAVTGTTAYTSPTSASTVTWTGVTFASVASALIYNSTQGNKAVSVHTFSNQVITAGNFTLTYPTNGAGTALVNLA